MQAGKAKLTQWRYDLKDVTEEMRAENSAYTKLDPKGVKVSLYAGQIIPTILPVQYFKQPYVKVAEWVRTTGQAVQFGWSSYKESEFSISIFNFTLSFNLCFQSLFSAFAYYKRRVETVFL